MSPPAARRPTGGRAVRPKEAAGTGTRKGAGKGGVTGWEGAGRGRAARARTAVDPGERPARRADPDESAVRPEKAAGTTPGDAAPPRSRFSLRRRGAPAAAPRRPVPARFRRRRLVAGLAVAVALFVGVGLGSRLLLYDLGLANVTDVTVSGLTTVPEPTVRDAAAVSPGGPLISVDTDGAARRVAAVEGVSSVEVRRAWPHTIEILVTERVPVALWQGPQGLVEVDGTGLPYRRAPEPPPGLPRLAFAGVAPGDPATMAALAVLSGLTGPVRTQVATVEAAGTQVTLGLTDDRTVRWGGPERAADKIAVLAPLLGQPGAVYDVSSPDLPTVRR